MRALLRALCVLSAALGLFGGAEPHYKGLSPTHHLAAYVGAPALGPPLLFVVAVGATMVIATLVPEDMRLSAITSATHRRLALVASGVGFAFGWLVGSLVADSIGAGLFGLMFLLVILGCHFAQLETVSMYHEVPLGHEAGGHCPSETPSSPLHHRHVPGDAEDPEEHWFEFNETYRAHATDHEEFEV